MALGGELGPKQECRDTFVTGSVRPISPIARTIFGAVELGRHAMGERSYHVASRRLADLEDRGEASLLLRLSVPERRTLSLII